MVSKELCGKQIPTSNSLPRNVFSVTRTSTRKLDNSFLPPATRSSMSQASKCPRAADEWWTQQKGVVDADKAVRQAAWIERHRRTAGRRKGESSSVRLPAESSFRDESIAVFILQTEAANRDWRMMREGHHHQASHTQMYDPEDAALQRWGLQTWWQNQRRAVTDVMIEYIVANTTKVKNFVTSTDRVFFRSLSESIQWHIPSRQKKERAGTTTAALVYNL